MGALFTFSYLFILSCLILLPLLYQNNLLPLLLVLLCQSFCQTCWNRKWPNKQTSMNKTSAQQRLQVLCYKCLVFVIPPLSPPYRCICNENWGIPPLLPTHFNTCIHSSPLHLSPHIISLSFHPLAPASPSAPFSFLTYLVSILSLLGFSMQIAASTRSLDPMLLLKHCDPAPFISVRLH